MISLAELKTYLNITNTDKDDQLNQAIDLAKGFIASYVWYSLELNTWMTAEFFNSSNEFFLARRWINSVSDIKYADDKFDPDFTSYNVLTDQKVFLEKWLVQTRDCIGPYTVITYSFGYDVWSCPDDLTAANLEIASTYYKKQWEISQQDVNSESVDWDQISFKAIKWAVPETALVILDKYMEYDFSS